MLAGMLEATAERHGTRTALIWGAERVDYSGLARAVRARAAELAKLGVDRSRTVALLLANGPDFVVDLFAIAAREAIAVPLNPCFQAREIQDCLRGCDLAAVVSELDTAAVAQQVADGWPAPVAVQQAGGGDGLSRAREKGAVIVGSDWSGDVLYGFSSGSTGTPKRIARTQAHLVAEADNFTHTVDLTPDDVILGAIPFFHAHGLGNCVLAAVRAGATLVIEPLFDPRASLARMASERVSVLPGVPFIFRMLADARAAERFDASALRLCFSAGAPLPLAIFDAFEARFGCPVRQLYGCSEAGSVTINLGPDARETAASVGRPMRNVEISIVDDEIVIASPALGRYDGAEGGADFRDGRFYSGDLGCLDDQGRLTITGRKKLYISTAAAKVDPIEVERCITEHPDVAEVVVVGVKARGGDEAVKAVIVRADAPEGKTQRELRREIVARCREHLANFKVPRTVEFRDKIPRSPLGKVLRKDML